MLACPDANERVRFTLVANGRQWSMPWMHHRVPVQGPEMGVNRLRKELEIASCVWQICATDRAGEQRVTHEQVVGGAVDPEQEADATQGVAWRVEHLEGQAQARDEAATAVTDLFSHCLLYTSPSPRDKRQSRMPSSA